MEETERERKRQADEHLDLVSEFSIAIGTWLFLVSFKNARIQIRTLCKMV